MIDETKKSYTPSLLKYLRENADHVKEKKRIHYLNNKEKYFESKERNKATSSGSNYCDTCDKFILKCNYSRHIKSKYHEKLANLVKDGSDELKKVKDRIKCEICNYEVLKNCYNRHLTSTRHIEKKEMLN